MVAELLTVAVPDISPLAVLKNNPLGREGDTEKLRTPVPPVAVTGVNAVAAMLCVMVLVAIACVTTRRRGSTVREKVLELDCEGLAESVTVTVWVVAVLDCVAVPDIEPFELLKVNPDGKLGLMIKVRGGVPPLAVTGVKLVMGVSTVSVRAAMACNVVSSVVPVPADRLKVALPACPAASVNVTV